MSEIRKKLSLDQLTTYAIMVPGELGEQWTDWYDGILITNRNEKGQFITTLTISVDQAALQSLLRRLYSLGLPLLSVKILENSDGRLVDSHSPMS